MRLATWSPFWRRRGQVGSAGRRWSSTAVRVALSRCELAHAGRCEELTQVGANLILVGASVMPVGANVMLGGASVSLVGAITCDAAPTPPAIDCSAPTRD